MNRYKCIRKQKEDGFKAYVQRIDLEEILSLKQDSKRKKGRMDANVCTCFPFGGKNTLLEMIFQKGVYSSKSPLLHRLLKHLRNTLAC